jgi:Ca-activated chloride channel family protein
MLALFGYSVAGLAPLAAAGVAAVGTAALVALYLLRERERRVAVAFVPLWDPGGGERRLERIGRRLRRWLSLLLQLVILWLLVFALVDPRPAASARAARTWLVLVDRSASMAGGPRMDQARALAHQVIAGLEPEDRAMVATFAADVVAASGFEGDRTPLHTAIDRFAAEEQGTDAGRAFAFAAAALRGRPHPTLVLISDGPLAGPPLPGIEVRFLPVGAPSPNVALLSFSARRRPLDGGAVDAAVVVQSFAGTAQSGTLELSAGGRALERVALSLGPGERLVRTLGPLASTRADLEARFLPAGPDLLAFDDRAFAVVPERTRRKVLVVGAPNLYLDGALLSFGDALVVRRVTAARPEEWSAFDVVIFDGVAPSPPPGSGRYLYFDPQGAGSPWPVQGKLAAPIATDLDRHDPLLAQLSLADLNVKEARRLGLGVGDRAVAGALGVPLLLTRQRPGLKMVALSFDIRRSDLPLRPTFPLLLANALEWLDARHAPVLAGRRTGTTARVPVAGGIEQATVSGPGGSGRVAVVAGAAEVPLPRSGFYRVEPSGDGLLAANLFDGAESDTRMTPSCAVGGQSVPPWRAPRPNRHQSWPTLALVLAAVLSLAEWATHHRRWTV